MLLVGYESGGINPADELESFCRLEGLDYAYVRACAESRPGRKGGNKPDRGKRGGKGFGIRFWGRKDRKAVQQPLECSFGRTGEGSLIAD